MADEANPIMVQKHLKGVDYPASKDELLRTAQLQDAPQHVMRALRGMPDREYGSPTDVTKAIT